MVEEMQQLLNTSIKKDDLTEYYIQTNDTKEYLHVDETKIIASFFLWKCKS